MPADLLQFRQPQAQRLARFAAAASCDVHCHCLPGLDDGPPTLAAAVAICRALVADGITAVIATPHQLGQFEAVTARVVRRAVEALQAELARLDIPLTVRPGGEIRVDERLLALLAADEVLTLGDGGKYVLIELPHSALLDLRPMIDALIARGITPVIAHPERHQQLARAPQLLVPWLTRGAILQVTGGSLTGAFGPSAFRAAWQMMDAGWVSLVATDAHDTAARGPTMTLAIDAVAAHSGHAVARRLCVQNPQAVYDGLPVPRPRVVARRPTDGRP